MVSEHTNLSELPIELPVIGHYLGYSRDFNLPGQESRVSQLVNMFLSSENSGWNCMMQLGGCFSMGNEWMEYVGASKNLRILSACLCSGRTGLFVDTDGRKNLDIKKELKTLLQSLDERERDIFKKHVGPVIEPLLGRIIHTFQIHIVEDAIGKIKKIQEVVDKVLRVPVTTVAHNMDVAKLNVKSIEPKDADTHIFFLDGQVPPPEKEEPFSTSELIRTIQLRFENVVIISNTNDAFFQKSHRQAGAHEFANNDPEIIAEILERIRIERLFI